MARNANCQTGPGLARNVRADITQAVEVPEIKPVERRLRASIALERIGDIVEQIELPRAEALPGTLGRTFSRGVLMRLENLQRRGVR